MTNTQEKINDVRFLIEGQGPATQSRGRKALYGALSDFGIDVDKHSTPDEKVADEYALATLVVEAEREGYDVSKLTL